MRHGSGSIVVYQFLRHIRPAPIAVVLKRLLGVKRRVLGTTRGQFYIDPVSLLGFTLLERGEHEPQMIKALERILKPANTFVDLGANEGYFTVIASRLVGPTGRVIAVEPQVRLDAVIQENLRINDARNVTLCQVAISDRPGTASLHLSPDTNSGATGLTQPTKYPVPTQDIETITLSELLSRNGAARVDLLKVDIEGYEYEAILGSPSVFERHRVHAIALELHPGRLRKRGLDPARLSEFLHDCGYIVDSRFSNLVFVAPGIAERRLETVAGV